MARKTFEEEQKELDKELVYAGTVTGPASGMAIRSFLESINIPCSVKQNPGHHGVALGMGGSPSISNFYLVYVRRKDLKKAREVIEEYNNKNKKGA